MVSDGEYLELILTPIRVCADYKPMFGQERKKGGLTLDQFQALYGADTFYSWFGFDSPLVYSAHRVSGGLSSMYRQIGIGCQWFLNRVLRDQLGLSEADANWSYSITKPDGASQKLTLDGRIPLMSVVSNRQPVIDRWLTEAANSLSIERGAIHNGAVFEIRQGYKSKDSKRQTADVANAANAYAYQYMPVVVLLSNQIDTDVVMRYSKARWLILRGTLSGTPLDSTYVFFRDVIGYDVAGFFARNAATLKSEITTVMEKLLGAE